MSKNKKTIVIIVSSKNNRHRNTRHHRKPRSAGGLTTRRNLSKVPEDEHMAFHALFVNSRGKTSHPEKIAKRAAVIHRAVSELMLDEKGKLKSLEVFVQELNEVWLDPDYQIQIENDEDVGIDNI